MLMNDEQEITDIIKNLNRREKPFAETFNTMYLTKDRVMLASFPITGKNEIGKKIESEKIPNTELFTEVLGVWRKIFNAGKSIILDKAVFDTIKFGKRVTLYIDLNKATIKMTWNSYDATLTLEMSVFVSEGKGQYKIILSGALLQTILKALKNNTIQVYIYDNNHPILFTSEKYETTGQYKQNYKVIRQWVLVAPIWQSTQ